ncbi:MAG: hypothetical protein HY746_09910 [Elusimicrobia bacterium]|nr:hypothetical protein [Elusimicrobiota bacterium]
MQIYRTKRPVRLTHFSRTLFIIVSALAFNRHINAQTVYSVPDSTSTRFLLLDRPEPDRIFSPVEEKPGRTRSLDDINNSLPVSDYSQDLWNKARKKVESGDFFKDEALMEPAVETSTQAETLPPQPEIEFRDSGTTLSLTGRKVIGFSYNAKRWINPQTTVNRPMSTNLFEITQALQVRMQGKVGNNITVNVDYDDTKQDKQDISVVYQGEPTEVVQKVAFGDIDLSLPSTEFVSYNKQLFGIRADFKTERVKATLVGSRTKGQTKTKQFIGNMQFQAVDILDTQYLRRQYYDIIFGNTLRLPIKQGSEKIYIDRQLSAPADGVTIFEKTADDLAVQSSSYTGKFQLLNPGIDYVMDYAKGLVTFNSSLNQQDTFIIDFENSNGTKLSMNSSTSTLDTAGTGNFKLIKTKNDFQIAYSSETGYNRELKTYYSIGQSNIVRDDGRGNFTLKVQDLNRQTITNPSQSYPDTIHVDFEQGKFYMDNPFTVSGSTEPDPQTYSAAPASKRIIRVEYYYRFKTFMLEPNIVLQSEIVKVDGAKWIKNQDYYIDYDSGFITFYNPEKIKQTSVIDIAYEVSPFGGIGTQSIVGGRVSYEIFKNRLSVGSTLIYQGGTKSNTVPNVTDLSNSMTVYEGDAQIQNINLLGIRSNFSGELAQSKLNPNLNDFALIDNMEGIKQEDSASLDNNYWLIAANPTEGPADPNALVNWYSENVKSKDINAQSSSEGTQQVLSVNYDFNVSSEVSIVYPLSTTGLDFSQKNTLELVLYGENSAGAPGPRVNIHLGQISEDPDNTGGQNFTCASGINLTGAPKSEDANCDSQLSNSEDIGWLYDPGNDGINSKTYGAGNGRIDTLDLDKNGRLDSVESQAGGSFGYRYGSVFIDDTDSGNTKNKVDFTGWHTWHIPLNISSTDTYKWNAIKQVRISLKQSPDAGAVKTGTVKLARISAVGNSWLVNQSTITGNMQVLAVNNSDNPGYTPIYDAGGEATQAFNELYGSVSELKEQKNTSVINEQTLSMEYSNMTSSSTLYAYKRFTRAIDISQHKYFKFLVKNEGPVDSNASFYLKAGDENNYYQVAIPLDFGVNDGVNNWRLYKIEQQDITGDGIPDVWTNASNHSVTISSRGSPSLQQIPMIITSVKVTDAVLHNGKIYLNELHLAEPLTRTGNAWKAEASFEIPGWMSFGGKHRFVNRNFQTPVTAIANQDNKQDTGYLNLTRLSFFPMNFNYSRQKTETPNTLLTGANNLVNSLQQGIVIKQDGTAAGTFTLGRLPRIGLNYLKNWTDYDKLIGFGREDEKDAYSGNMSWGIPLNVFLVPKNLDANYSFSRSRVAYDPYKTLGLSDIYDTDEITHGYGIKLPFIPWKGSSLNAGYNLQKTKEKKSPPGSGNTGLEYPKSMQQTVDFNSNFRLFSWLNPGVNYSVTAIENNNLNITTATVAQSSAVFQPGEIKTVNRTSQGGVSLTLNMNDLISRNKLLRSMILSSNYQIQDGDIWQNVEKDFNSGKYLWVRRPLKPGNILSYRSSLTMRDTWNSTQRWQPFEGYSFKGRTAPLSTLSVTNNYTNTMQKSEVTGTVTRTSNITFPDMVLSIAQIELLTHTEKWAKSGSMNFKFSKNSNETKGISLDAGRNYGLDLRFRLLDFMDTAASYNDRISEKKDLRSKQITQESEHNDATIQGTFDMKKFRFTAKLDYVSDLGKGALGVKTQDTATITPSVLIRYDLELLKGLKIPFIKNPLLLTNKISWTTTLSYAIKKSPITISDNSKLLSLNSSADYEPAKNLRITLNAAVQRLWHKFLKQEEYISYQAGGTLTFQF